MKANLKIEATVHIVHSPGVDGADDSLVISFDRGRKSVFFQCSCDEWFQPCLDKEGCVPERWFGGENASEFLMQAFESLMQDDTPITKGRH